MAAHAAASGGASLQPGRAADTVWAAGRETWELSPAPAPRLLKALVCAGPFAFGISPKQMESGGPLSPGDSDSIGSWPLTGHTHDL